MCTQKLRVDCSSPLHPCIPPPLLPPPPDARGYGSQWDRYFDQLGPLVRRMPYMTSVGNHEVRDVLVCGEVCVCVWGGDRVVGWWQGTGTSVLHGQPHAC